jgi:hypothetical protein
MVVGKQLLTAWPLLLNMVVGKQFTKSKFALRIPTYAFHQINGSLFGHPHFVNTGSNYKIALQFFSPHNLTTFEQARHQKQCVNQLEYLQGVCYTALSCNCFLCSQSGGDQWFGTRFCPRSVQHGNVDSAKGTQRDGRVGLITTIVIFGKCLASCVPRPHDFDDGCHCGACKDRGSQR